MKKIITLAFVICFSSSAYAQLYFPPKQGNQWDTVSPASLGWCVDKLDTLSTFLADNNTKGFIILKNGKIAFEKYFGSFTQDSTWYWASAGKSLFAFLAGQAVEQGYFALTDTVSTYLDTGWTSCLQNDELKISIRDMLAMSTGLDDGVPDNDCTLPSCLQCLADPNTRWAYHNAPYTLSHQVLENATNQTINGFTIQNLLLKTGMFGIWIQLGYNEVFASRTRDMARFGLLMLNRGIWDADTLLADSTYFNAMVTTSQQQNLSYGLLWWLNGNPSHMLPGTQFVFNGPLIPNAPGDAWCALGKNDQKLYVIPSEHLVVVRQGNDAGGGGLAPTNFDNDLWAKINELICSGIGMVESSNQKSIGNAWVNFSNKTLTIEANESCEFALYNTLGQTVHSGRLSAAEKTEIMLSASVYIIHLKNQEGLVQVEKLIVD
jgi:CubicO group peptidase (beta-lactamase class C family)